jgi:hypothetical protein
MDVDGTGLARRCRGHGFSHYLAGQLMRVNAWHGRWYKLARCEVVPFKMEWAVQGGWLFSGRRGREPLPASTTGRARPTPCA